MSCRVQVLTCWLCDKVHERHTAQGPKLTLIEGRFLSQIVGGCSFLSGPVRIAAQGVILAKHNMQERR